MIVTRVAVGTTPVKLTPGMTPAESMEVYSDGAYLVFLDTEPTVSAPTDNTPATGALVPYGSDAHKHPFRIPAAHFAAQGEVYVVSGGAGSVVVVVR